jgi:hypothetical protein
MRLLSWLGALALVAAGSSAQAQTTGTWRVNGAIAGRTFVLDCRFEQKDAACTDASPGGKTHRLTSQTFAGRDARWSFDTRVMLMSIALSFEGKIDGSRMAGTMTAAGRHGTFTAVRS